jgi:hypothetical protein
MKFNARRRLGAGTVEFGLHLSDQVRDLRTSAEIPLNTAKTVYRLPAPTLPSCFRWFSKRQREQFQAIIARQ